ncbi:hypothetical protein M407DRAFT_149218 [Tulasnella calospora MUT 4182]|uniref:Retrotransposon gag domain-containing protein n=1 Tax=Tulasnella calospora MUT 4182 TaxID=1051891 RepID=A0A0C3QRY3_9AGAM|nr:hypothetical protein M407DRAFT_149218 [Tulasnella calospora MUT 4182]
MSTTQDIEPFQGGNWEECSAFIQRIRAAAWREMKFQEPAWMAYFASLHLSGDALTWYLRLPPEVQGDWAKLQAALVAQWSLSGSDIRSDPPNVPIAATAAYHNGNKKRDHLERGVLKVEVAGRAEAVYVGWDVAGYCTTTNDAEKALRFRFESQSNSTLLECVNRRPYSWLAIHWKAANPDVGRGSTHYAYLTAVDSETLKSPTGQSGPFQIAVCRVASSGEATFIWRNGNTETVLTVLTNGTRLYPVPDPDSAPKNNDEHKIATLLIQAVN